MAPTKRREKSPGASKVMSMNSTPMTAIMLIWVMLRPRNLPHRYCRRLTGLDRMVRMVPLSISLRTMLLPTKTTTSKPKTVMAASPISVMILPWAPTVRGETTAVPASITKPKTATR